MANKNWEQKMPWHFWEDKTERRLLELVVLSSLIYWMLYSFYAEQWFNESLNYGGFTLSAGVWGRPVLYTFILESIQRFFGSYKPIQIIQYILFPVGLGYLVIQLYRFVQNKAVAFVFLFLVLLNYQLFQYPLFVLTESFIMTLAMVAMGLLCHWARTGEAKSLWWMSLCIGLSIILKSSTYAWLMLLLMVFIWIITEKKESKIKGFLSLSLPVALCLLLSTSINYIKNGILGNESALGEMLIGKAGVIVDDHIASSQPAVIKKMNEIARPIQHYIAKTESTHMRYLMTWLYYDAIRFSRPILNEYPHESWVQVNQYRRDVSMAIIAQKPLAYAEQIGLNYMALWLGWDLLTFTEYNNLFAFVRKAGAMPYYTNITTWNHFQLEPRTRIGYLPAWYVYFYRFFLSLAGFLSFVLPCWIIVKWVKKHPVSATLWVATTAALTIQGFFILTAVVNNSSFRYAITMWPAVAFVVAISLVFVVNRQKSVGEN